MTVSRISNSDSVLKAEGTPGKEFSSGQEIARGIEIACILGEDKDWSKEMRSLAPWFGGAKAGCPDEVSLVTLDGGNVIRSTLTVATQARRSAVHLGRAQFWNDGGGEWKLLCPGLTWLIAS